MLKVGITGIHGMIGWHLNSFFYSMDGISVVPAGRDVFLDDDLLDRFVVNSDVIVHLAGMNRGEDDEVENVNISLTRTLISGCKRNGSKPHMIFASSTHVERDTPYGSSKKKCAELFNQWSNESNSVFTNLIMPHIFGEGGKPFYNSAVSTFCYQLANNQTPEIINDGELELVHTQQVAERVFDVIRNSISGDIEIKGVPIKVSELLQKLKNFDDLYKQNLIPQLKDRFDVSLFNTYRSYLIPSYYPVMIKLHQDDRGDLFETIKSNTGGQCFISTTKPGITRGNHYHFRKIERFLVISGRGIIRLRKLFSDEVYEFEVSGDIPQYIDIPTLYTHNITNVGDNEMTTLFWSNEIFDPVDPDTFAEDV